MSTKRRPLTGVSKAPDGTYFAWCRVCTKRMWRELKPEERARGGFDSRESAHAQIERHRRSARHHQSLEHAADQKLTKEQRLLDRIFETDSRKPPCDRCGERHHARMRCSTAKRIRSDGATPR